ncbi:MAG: ABC transporter ATP-binding protein [Chloroflexi bacterium]|nr:ABC transporter ATP-binding protein [Chloroflexota bacterium]MBP8059189.1 ABC transporter ATP-binding protein [Chloroflexota bacterium]
MNTTSRKSSAPPNRQLTTKPALTPEQSRATTNRLFSYLLPFRRGWILVIVTIFFSTLASSLTLRLIPKLLDEDLPLALDVATRSEGKQAIGITLLFMIITTLVGVLLMRQARSLIARLAQGMMVNIRTDYYRSLTRQSLGFYRQNAVGSLTNVVTGDAETIGFFFTQQAPLLLLNAGQLLLALFFMLTLSWQLTLLSLLLVIVLQGVSLAVVLPWIQRLAAAYRDHLNQLAAHLTENLTGMREIQIFTQEARSVEQFRGRLDKLARININNVSLTASNVAIFYALNGLGLALVYGIGALRVIDGAVGVGDLVSFAGFFTQFISPITVFSTTLVSIQSVLISAQRLFALMDTPPQVQDRPDAIDPGRLRGRIRFEEMSFSYQPDDDKAWGVVHINLEIEPGEKIAFVGGSGTGKTTLLDLVSRFYDVTQGQVTIDGYDVRSLRLEALRRNIGLVPQKPTLFSGTLADNLRFGNPTASDEAVQSAAAIAQANIFIEALPDGYDTLIGSGGQGLSGGQAQRMSIARALVTDPPILILDEATSALDTRTERMVAKALDAAAAGRTTLVIAHRLSTITNADRIVVMGTNEKGQGIIKAVGTHQELLEKSPDYALLYEKQARRKVILMPIGPNYNTTPVLPTVVGLSRSYNNAPVYVLDFGTISDTDKIIGERFGVQLSSQATTWIDQANHSHRRRVKRLMTLLEEEDVESFLIPAEQRDSWIEATIVAVEQSGATHLVALDNPLVPLNELRADIRQIEREADVEYILVDPLKSGQLDMT